LGAPRSSSLTFESSYGTETIRVRIADWSSARKQAANEEETQQKQKRQKPLLKEKKK
jgi:hypothetical protein